MIEKQQGHQYGLKNINPPSLEDEPIPEYQDVVFMRKIEGEIVHGGTTNEEVLEMMIHRMKYLQRMMACRENAIVITKLEEALMWLNARTSARKEQGVEGQDVQHK